MLTRRPSPVALLAALLASLAPLRAAAPVSLQLERPPPWPRHTIDDTSKGADGVKLADFDGDGRPDIATGWEEGGVVRIYRHPGLDAVTRPWPRIEAGRVPSPEDALLFDVDGDGRLDVVSATEGNNRSLYVHWAPAAPGGAWRTEAFPAAAKRQAWMFALPFDVDGENGPDLVVGSKLGQGALGWLRAPTDRRRLDGWTYQRFRDAGWIMSILAADMNHDGRPDVLFSDRRGPTRGIFWLEHPGAARASTEAWREHRVTPAGDTGEVMFIAHGDLDGDGRAEIVAAVKPSRLCIFRQRATDTWEPEWLELHGELGTAKAVSIGDLNGDGRADLVMSCEDATGPHTGVVWLEQLPGGRWKLRDLGGPAGVKFDLVPLVDLDGDGDLDVVTTEERDLLGVVWYENPTRDRRITPPPRK